MRQQRGGAFAHRALFETAQQGAGVNAGRSSVLVYMGRGSAAAGRSVPRCVSAIPWTASRLTANGMRDSGSMTPWNRRDDSQIGERAQQLLKVLIESYIRDGQPVGSRSLSRDSGMNLQHRHHPQCDGGSGGLRLRDVRRTLLPAGCPPPRAIAFSSTPCCRCGRWKMPRQTTCAGSSRPPTIPRSLVSMASQLLSNVTQMTGRRDAAVSAGRVAHAYRVRAAVRAARARHPGVRRSRSAEPRRASGAVRSRPKTCAARPRC